MQEMDRSKIPPLLSISAILPLQRTLLQPSIPRGISERPSFFFGLVSNLFPVKPLRDRPLGSLESDLYHLHTRPIAPKERPKHLFRYNLCIVCIVKLLLAPFATNIDTMSNSDGTTIITNVSLVTT